MDINLRLPSGELNKDDEQNGIDNMLDGDMKLHNGDLESGNVTDVGDEVGADSGHVNALVAETAEFKDVLNLEPLPGMEFDSHGDAYSFYQEYARAMGFNTAIQNSRRSKTSREFIDAKFACGRYGTKREYDKSHRPRSRQIKLDAENGTGRRACGKTDCKASMHVKRRPDGKWVIHSFVKDHNHDLLPAQAISEQTRRIYAVMAKRFAEYKNGAGLKSDSRNSSNKGRNLPLESGDGKTLLDFMAQMQSIHPNFFYAVYMGEDCCLKSLFWADNKSRHDYPNFCDVVSFDTTYVRNKYKMPLALFLGVNHHGQLLLLGCALVSDESGPTYSWLMQTWLKAMGGQAPKVIITDQDKALKSVIPELFPDAYHCFFLWHVLGKVSENLGTLIKQHGNFIPKFEKCIYRSSTEEEFSKRWWKILDRFDLKEDEFMQSLYEDRRQWAPTFMGGACLAGMSTGSRSESLNSFFDKYVHKKTTALDFVKHYDAILQDRYEEEAKADSDTWSKQPALRSPSPFEKSVSGVYTNAIFKKFQFEVLGAVACHPKHEGRENMNLKYRVQDFEKNKDFIVLCDEKKPEVSCMCRMFEYKGYLCRHALVVLQMRSLLAIPSQYILKRWTKDAKSRHLSGEEPGQVQSRVHRYNNLFQLAMKLCEEGSVSQESYSSMVRSLEELFNTCLSMNTSSKNLAEAVTSPTHGLICIEEEQSRSMNKNNKKKNSTKKRKVNSEPEVMAAVGAQDNLQQMDKLSPRAVTLDSYYGAQQSVPGMVQLNLMDSHRDNYYGNQQAIQGLGQLNSLAPSHGGYYSTQQTIPGLGQMDFFRAPTFTYGIRQDDPNVRTGQLHDDASRHG